MGAVWSYNETSSTNAWGTEGTLSEFISNSILSEADMKNSTFDNIAKYLQYKIGYITDGKPYGMCASVLNQCQDYTYDDGKYNYDNEVVKAYLERTLVQIKAQQEELLASYAESCLTDVTSCLSDNGWSNSSKQKPSPAQIKACESVIKTCQSLTSTGGSTTDPYDEWIGEVLGTDGPYTKRISYELNGCATGFADDFVPSKYIMLGQSYNLPASNTLKDWGSGTLYGCFIDTNDVDDTTKKPKYVCRTAIDDFSVDDIKKFYESSSNVIYITKTSADSKTELTPCGETAN